MLRFIFLFILLFHGLIHLLGFVKAWNLAPVPQLNGPTLFPLSASGTKAAGALWLLTCLGFLAAAAAFGWKKEYWWMLAAVSLVLSQLLVVLYWTDAKAGTVANLIVLAGLLPAWGKWSFDRMAQREIQTLLAAPPPAASAPVTAAQLEGLPACVQNWLTQSGAVGRDPAHTVHLLQKGFLRTTPDGKWMPAAAEQYFNVNEPGFIWTVDVQMPPGLPIAGRDKYLDGKGNMLIQLFALMPVVNGSGEKIDQGSLLRFLGEMVWFPSAALSPYIRWEAVDDHSAKATMQYKGVTASAVFRFDAAGNVILTTAERYMGSGDKATLEHWVIPISEWREMNGVRIPTKGEVNWQLQTGDFSYYRWEIVAVDYNPRRAAP